MDQSFSTDQFSSYDYYNIGTDKYSSDENRPKQFLAAMRTDTPGEAALTTNLRLEQAGYSSELWAPCDKNKYCRQLGQPDGPVYSKETDYDKWTEHPPLTYQNRQYPVLNRYNDLAQTEIVPSRQTIARGLPVKLIPAELAAIDTPAATKYINDSGIMKKENFNSVKIDGGAMATNSAECIGIKITESGILIKFELIIFFIFLVLVALVFKRMTVKKGVGAADTTDYKLKF